MNRRFSLRSTRPAMYVVHFRINGIQTYRKHCIWGSIMHALGK